MAIAQLIILVVTFLVPMPVRAGEKIWISYNRGHTAAMALLMKAEKQLDNGDLDGALRNVNTAIQGDPKFWPALYTRAKIYASQHKWESATRDCNELLRQYPYLVEASLLRAEINAKMGRYVDSLKEIDHVVSIRPREDGLARALDQRAWLRLTCPDRSMRDPQKALKDAKTACNLILWKDAGMIDTLAVACAETGDFDSAIRYEEKALRTRDITAEETKQCQKHLALIQEHRPFWEQ